MQWLQDVATIKDDVQDVYYGPQSRMINGGVKSHLPQLLLCCIARKQGCWHGMLSGGSTAPSVSRQHYCFALSAVRTTCMQVAVLGGGGR